MCILNVKKLINSITLNCSEVFMNVTKATNSTGSKPARGTPFTSWLQQITMHSTFDCKEEAQRLCSDFTMLLIEILLLSEIRSSTN
jgi:hypothetical protein